MKRGKTNAKRKPLAVVVEPVVRRPNSVGVYWLSEDGGKTWMPAVVFKFRGRYWARDFLKVWPVANHREKTWGPKIEPPNPSVLLPPLGGGKEQRVVGRPSDLTKTKEIQ